jgi:hypothetical protein
LLAPKINELELWMLVLDTTRARAATFFGDPLVSLKLDRKQTFHQE